MDPLRPLLATADPTLVAHVERSSAAAGVTTELLADHAEATAVLAAWSGPPLVLLGADLLPAVAAQAPERRPGLVVLAAGAPGPDLFRRALAIGAEQVLELPGAADQLTRLLADLSEGHEPGRLVGLLGGAGGAGASTLAAALGRVGSQHGPSLVVDTDPWGPGQDRLLGLDEVEGIGWDALSRSQGRLSARDLRTAVPSRDGLGVLTHRAGPSTPPEPGLVREVLAAARRGHRLVSLDLARHGPGTPEWAARCDLLLVVVPDSLAGVAAAARTCAALPDTSRAGLVLRGPRLDPGTVADAVGLPVLAAMRHQRRLDEGVDLGLGPVRSRRGPLARTARELLACVA